MTEAEHIIALYALVAALAERTRTLEAATFPFAEPGTIVRYEPRRKQKRPFPTSFTRPRIFKK